MSEQVAGPVVNGLDIYTFPGVLPEDVVFIERFPVCPFPAQLAHIKADLLDELAQAQPDALGRRSACVLVAEDRGYGGHSMTDVTDSFSMAIDGLSDEAELYGAMTVSTGMHAKEKSSLPSGADFDRLAPRLVPDAKFCVLHPDDLDVCRFVPVVALKDAYEITTPYEFMGTTVFQSKVEALQQTSLSVRDCEFVAQLRFAGIQAGIQYYLTGSSAGRGGPSTAINPGPYHDLDVLAVGGGDKSQITAEFEASAEKFYGPLQKQAKLVRAAESNALIAGRMYSSQSAGISIDFYSGASLEDILVRPENLERGQLLRLS